MKIIIFAANSYYTLFNFRKNLIKRLCAKGYEVHLVASFDGHENDLADTNLILHDVPLSSSHLSVLRLIKSYYYLVLLFMKKKPEVVCSFTIIPNYVFGSLNYFFSFKFIPNITGQGRMGSKKGLQKLIYHYLNRLLLNTEDVLFVQNLRDKIVFQKQLPTVKIRVLPGSGVPLEEFNATASERGQVLKIGYFGRFIKEKGYLDFLESMIYLPSHVQVTYIFAGGDLNISNQKNEKIVCLGKINDIQGFLKEVDCVILPTYYNEGVPRSLLEALAAARPIITTNVAGCSELLIDSGPLANGIYCEIKSPKSIAKCIEEIYSKTDDELRQMGINSRKLAATKYDENIVIDAYEQAIDSLI